MKWKEQVGNSSTNQSTSIKEKSKLSLHSIVLVTLKSVNKILKVKIKQRKNTHEHGNVIK